MKKLSLLLVALVTLPFSFSYSVERQNAAMIVGGLAILGGGYYYYTNYYNKTPNNIPSQQKELNPLLTAAIHQDKETINKVITLQQSVTPKPSVVITPTSDKKTTQSVPKKTIETPSILSVVTENSITEVESGFLNNLRISVKKMDLERLLKENMDILEG